ncbi:MAG: DegV family protein [Clostridia bacterium]|nr:DegV family protein [Clostridia bacterium]
MNDFVICTDSASDIKKETLESWGVHSVSLTFRFNGEDKVYYNDEVDVLDFYNKMRAGGVAKTAAVNPGEFSAMFEPILSAGSDLLYLGFSSGLSTTYNSARIAAETLSAKYPERKIITVDTLAASAGEGLLVRLAVNKKNDGASVEETADYVKAMIPKLCHWFTVDDLVYLQRGGRISAASAFFGNALGIKPVLHVDDEGHLVNVSKVRGRRSAINMLADKYDELADDREGGIVYISHADCMRDVEQLANIIKQKHGASVEIVTDVGPVIGAHSGPGTLALFFVGKNK